MDSRLNNKPTILYVDDEYYNLSAFVAAFRKFYKIFTSSSPRDAMAILKAEDIDLIITDQRMPEMTGVEFLEVLQKEFPGPVRMILTGFTDVAAIKQAINEGSVLRYITKPWDVNELKLIIDKGIKIHELEENQHKLLKILENEVKQKKENIAGMGKNFSKDEMNHIVKLASDQTHDKNIFRNKISILSMRVYSSDLFSEATPSQVIVDYLQHYFDVLIDEVNKHHGFIYKITNGGLLAVFAGSAKNNSQHAVACAFDTVNEFNKNMRMAANHEATLRIGMATGTALIGKIHLKNKLEYAVLGKCVQKAEEIVAVGQGSALIIDEASYNEIKNEVVTEELKTICIEEGNGKLYKVVAKKS